MALKNAFENLSTEAKQDTQVVLLSAIRDYVDTVETRLTSVDGKDFATQTTLASAKGVLDNILLAVDALEAGFTTLNGKDFATQTTLGAAKITLDNILLAVDQIEGYTDTLTGKDYATQVTLAAVLTELGQKLEPGGQVALDAASLAALETITVANPTANPETGLAKEITLASVLAKLSSDPATQTTLAAVLAKLSSDPATGVKQDTLAGKVPDEEGTWSYSAGVSGTVNVGAGKRVIGIAATGGTGAASMTINGGDSVPIPANMSIEFAPRGNLVAPTIVLTGTVSYVVEAVGA